jgi:uncharacterized membrane protein
LQRLSYIDWMRGLACLLMFQAHCYDSWLRPDLHQTYFYRLSQIAATLPAPLFIFLAGVSFALVTEKLREKKVERGAVAKQTLLRGAEIFGLGMVFRVQEYVLGYKFVTWTDLLRVDVLNILGVSMVLMGVFCWSTAGGEVAVALRRSIVWSVAIAVVIGLLTPLLWTTWRPKFLPWPVESYLNGVHVFGEPQHWLFPIFPWAAFAFAGLAAGFLLFSRFAREQEPRFFAVVACSGVAAIALSILFDRSPVQLYAVYDYWHASPEFLLVRCGVLLLVTAFAYAWCRWGLALKGFSPAIQFGKTSLLVYWVHIEFVYGRLSILPKHKCGIALATLGLCGIFLGMLALSLWRTRSKKRTVKALESGSRPVAEAATL